MQWLFNMSEATNFAIWNYNMILTWCGQHLWVRESKEVNEEMDNFVFLKINLVGTFWAYISEHYA